MRGLRNWITRLAFVALFALPASYCSYQVSPIKLGSIEATVHEAKTRQAALGTWGLNPESNHQLVFTTKEFPCAFRYPFYYRFHDWHQPPEEALAEGDPITIIYQRDSLGPASKAAGVDCLTGATLPGRSPYAAPTRPTSPHLIEVMDVWHGYWTVLRWIPQQIQWIVISAAGFILALVILFAPLIDRLSGHGPGRKARRDDKRLLRGKDDLQD